MARYGHPTAQAAPHTPLSPAPHTLHRPHAPQGRTRYSETAEGTPWRSGSQSLFEKYQAASRLSIKRVIATYTNVSLVLGNSS